MIETERLLLAPADQGDVHGILDYYRTNEEHLRPWEPAWPPDFLTPEFWPARIEHAARECAAGVALRFFIRPLDERRRIIGTLSVTQIQRGAGLSCTIGYGLAEAEQGKGLMKEAVRGTVAHAFDKMGMHRVTAGYMPRNRRSASVLSACGFHIEGYARAYLLINGVWEDHVLTAIINPSPLDLVEE